MDVFEAIETRRAVKHFALDHALTDGELDRLLGAVLRSPTAFNIQNWRFVILRDQEHRARVREAAWDQSQVTDASLLVVVCADTKSWEKQPERYWRNAPEEVREFILPAINSYYAGREQVQRDEAMRSAGLAAQTLMLAATAMGYQSCPMDGFDYGKVGELINLPDDHVVCLMVAVGRGIKDPWPRAGRLERDAVVVRDRF